MPAKTGADTGLMRESICTFRSESRRLVAAAHLIDVAVFCASDDPHTGTAAELVGWRAYLCPALIYPPNHSAFSPSDLSEPVLAYGRRSRSWCLTQPSCRSVWPMHGCLVGKRESAPIPAGCSDDQQAPLAGEADLRFGAGCVD